jgi:NAD-reducing hydrogenase large subunit
MIEVLHCVEKIRELLNDPDLQGTDLVARGQRREEGIGVIEAPRGNLIHHYEVDENDQVTYCNLIVSTTHNNEGMNRAVKRCRGASISRAGHNHRRHAEPYGGRDPRL